MCFHSISTRDLHLPFHFSTQPEDDLVAFVDENIAKDVSSKEEAERKTADRKARALLAISKVEELRADTEASLTSQEVHRHILFERLIGIRGILEIRASKAIKERKFEKAKDIRALHEAVLASISALSQVKTASSPARPSVMALTHQEYEDILKAKGVDFFLRVNHNHIIYYFFPCLFSLPIFRSFICLNNRST